MASGQTGAGSGKQVTVTPPQHFAMVEEGVYRCAYPATHNGRYLQTLGLRTVVTLSLEALPMQTRRMLEGQGARILPLGPQAWVPRNNFDESLLVQALDVILNADNHPVLVTCATGRLQTCAVVGVLRRLQGWCLASVDSETQLFMHRNKGSHHVAVVEAVETFDVASFMASVVQPRILAQKAAAATVQQLSEDAAAGSMSPSPSKNGEGRLSSTQTPKSVEEATKGAAEAAAREAVERVVDGSTEAATARVVAPLPLWFLRGLRHNAALSRLVTQKPTASPAALEPQHDGVDTLVALVRHQKQQVSSGASSSVRRLPHEEFRTVALAPLISDRNGYNKGDCLVDSDDD